MVKVNVATEGFVKKEIKEVNDRIDILNRKTNEISLKLSGHIEDSKKEHAEINEKLDIIINNLKRIDKLEKAVFGTSN